MTVGMLRGMESNLDSRHVKIGWSLTLTVGMLRGMESNLDSRHVKMDGV